MASARIASFRLPSFSNSFFPLSLRSRENKVVSEKLENVLASVNLGFNVYKFRRSGGLTTIPERVLKVLVHGPCGDSAAGAFSGIVNIACPAIGYIGVCGCDCGIGDDRVGLGAVVVSEGRTYRVFGCDHQGRAVSFECSFVGVLKIRVRFHFPHNKAMSILIPYPHMVTRMECWKLNSTMSLVKAELLVHSIRPFFCFHCLAFFGMYIGVQVVWVDRQLCSQVTPY